MPHTPIFNLLPIDWNGIAAILTAIAVTIAFLAQWSYRKKEKENERRELIERIIVPILKDVDKAEIFLTREARYINSIGFCWEDFKKESPHLIAKLDTKAYSQIDNVSKSLKELQRITNELLPDVGKIVKNAIYSTIAEFNSTKNNAPTMDDSILGAHLSCDLNGQHFAVELYTLVVRQISWDGFLEKMAQKCGLTNTRRSNEQISIPTLGNLAEFEKIMTIGKILEKIDEKINNHSKKIDIRNYFEKYSTLLQQSEGLKNILTTLCQEQPSILTKALKFLKR